MTLQLRQIISGSKEGQIDQVIGPTLNPNDLHASHQRCGDVTNKYERKLIPAITPYLAQAFGNPPPDSPMERGAILANHNAGVEK